MTIDERLDRLTERHEALTQSVELLVHSMRQHEEKQHRNEDLQHKNEIMLAQVIESIDSLARIAHAHEHRITGLEGV
jgi:hypothetical protein